MKRAMNLEDREPFLPVGDVLVWWLEQTHGLGPAG